MARTSINLVSSVLRVRRVRPRDLSELGRGSVGRKSLRAPKCLNLEGFAGTRDPTRLHLPTAPLRVAFVLLRGRHCAVQA